MILSGLYFFIDNSAVFFHARHYG